MGVRDERTEDLFLVDMSSSGSPTEEGQVRYVGGDLLAYLSGSVKSLTTGSGLSPATHELLDTLVHNIAESNYQEIVRTGGQVSDLIWWTDSGKTTKIREINLTRSGGLVSQIVMKQYDGTGTIITGQTLTGTVSRTGGRVDNITWVET